MTGTNQLASFKEIVMDLLPKPWLVLAAIFLVVGFHGIPVAQATNYGTNITLFDGMVSGGTGWTNRPVGASGGGEDQEVEPNCVASQSWDLEGFYLKGTKLTMIGGFNFKAGFENVTSGDIFIKTDNGVAPKYGVPAGNTGYNKTVKNSFGYDYVVQLKFGAGSGPDNYLAYLIDEKTKVKTVGYQQNEGSNPWQYVSGGIEKGSGPLVVSDKGCSDTIINTGLDGPPLAGNGHYVVTVDLGFLPEGNYYFHFTEGCGNDDLMGRGKVQTPVTGHAPVPGTVLLLGTGLAGLVMFGRTRRS
jgi:hypothetical protein